MGGSSYTKTPPLIPDAGGGAVPSAISQSSTAAVAKEEARDGGTEVDGAPLNSPSGTPASLIGISLTALPASPAVDFHARVGASPGCISTAISPAVAEETMAQEEEVKKGEEGSREGEEAERAESILVSLPLISGQYTYDALCATGAATLLLRCSATSQHMAADDQPEQERWSLLPRDLILTKMEENDAQDGAKASRPSAASSSTTISIKEQQSTRSTLHRDPSCASQVADRVVDERAEDARLDLLEEVELCSIVPLLPRAFPVLQLVQQLVPCTALFSSASSPYAAAASPRQSCSTAPETEKDEAVVVKQPCAAGRDTTTSTTAVLPEPKSEVGSTLHQSCLSLLEQVSMRHLLSLLMPGEHHSCPADSGKDEGRWPPKLPLPPVPPFLASAAVFENVWGCQGISTASSSVSGDDVALLQGDADEAMDSAAPNGFSSGAGEGSCRQASLMAFLPVKPENEEGARQEEVEALRQQQATSRPGYSSFSEAVQAYMRAASALPSAPVPPSPWRGGAVVEWASGSISYTRDVDGLLEEQQLRAQRHYHLPPFVKWPRYLATPADPLQAEHQDGSGIGSGRVVASTVRSHRTAVPAAGAVGATPLRTSVLLQLRRLAQLRRLRGSFIHDGPCGLAAATEEKKAMTTKGVPGTPHREEDEAIHQPLCCCFRCERLLFQFAQLPAMTSHAVARYLELLHVASKPPSSAGLPRPRPAATTGTRPAPSDHRHHDYPDGGGQGVVHPGEAFLSVQQWLSRHSRGKSDEERMADTPLTPLRPPSSSAASRRKRTPREKRQWSSASYAGIDVHWVDSAVLNEVVLVGAVPQSRPHQLRLVPPTTAFCMSLAQRLEEAIRWATQVLWFAADPYDSAAGDPSRASGNASHEGDSRVARSTAAGVKAVAGRAARLREVYGREVVHALTAAIDAEEMATLRRCLATSPYVDAVWFSEVGTESDNGGAEEAVYRSVRQAAHAHTVAAIQSAEDLIARVIITALQPVLHHRLVVMYELLRFWYSKALLSAHRPQCDAYQTWYSSTPSPAAVLRLLQRSHRFGQAIARCYPHCFSAESSRRDAASPSSPSSVVAPSAPSLSVDDSLLKRFKTEPRGAPSFLREESARADSNGRSPTATSGLATSAPAISSSAACLSCEAEVSSEVRSTDSGLQLTSKPLGYVPEVALLDPGYLDRFTWWVDKTYHSHHHPPPQGSPSSSSSSPPPPLASQQQTATSNLKSVNSSSSSSQRQRLKNEQSPALRTLLRTVEKNGRTLTMAEITKLSRGRSTAGRYF